MYKKSDISNQKWMTFKYGGKSVYLPFYFNEGDIAFLVFDKQITRELRIVEAVPVIDIPEWHSCEAVDFAEIVTTKRQNHDVVKVFSPHGSLVLLTADIIGVNYNISQNDFKNPYRRAY